MLSPINVDYTNLKTNLPFHPRFYLILILLYLLYSKLNACDWLKKGLHFSKGERIRLNDRYMLKIFCDFQLFCEKIFIPNLIKHIVGSF